MPQVHVFGDLKRRTESKTRESAALQRAKRDERPSPLSRTREDTNFEVEFKTEEKKTCHKCMFSGT